MELSVYEGAACGPAAAGHRGSDVCGKYDALSVCQDHEDASSAVKPQQEAPGISLETFNLQIRELEKSERKLREALQNYMKSDPVLRTRIKELELSEKKLLQTVEQLNGDMHFLENVNLRIKCRLQDIQAELQEANEGKEKLERTHKEKVRRLQDHLRMKEGEIKSYLEYFEHYKEKRRQQMRMLREREHRLQNQVLKLEKEIVDCNTESSFLNTVEEPSSDDGLEQSIETDKFQNHIRLIDTEEGRDEARICNDDGEHHLKKQIQKLQNDLKTLLEREEANNGEREELVNRLQKSEDNEDFLNRKLEEFRCRISELKLTEYNLQQFLEDLEEENKRLKNELKVISQKEEENPRLAAEECIMHNIPDLSLENESSAIGKQKTTKDVESKDRSPRERELLLGLFERLGLRSRDALQSNGDVFKDLQSLVQTMQALKLQSDMAKTQSVLAEKERDSIQQDYQQMIGDFEGLQLAFDKTCCEYVTRVVELQQSAARSAYLESFFDYLNQAMQEPGKTKQLLKLCCAVAEFVNSQDLCGKYKDLLFFLSHLTSEFQDKLHGSASAAQQELSTMISATFNHLNHGKMLLSSFEQPVTPDHPEEPTKEPKEGFLPQEAVTQPPHSILSSQQTAYEDETYSVSFNSCIIPLAVTKGGVDSSTTTSNTTKSRWLKDSQKALKPDSAGVYSVPLKDSIVNLETEIIRLQAEKNEQRKLLEIKGKLLFQTSMEKRLLQETLQESNKLLHMWASKNEQYWKEPELRPSPENNGLHEQQQKGVYITTEQMNVRLETKKDNDHCLQGLNMSQQSNMNISQEMSAGKKENSFCFPVAAPYDNRRGQTQDIIQSEKGTLGFTTIADTINEKDVWCVQQHMEKKDYISDCSKMREHSDESTQRVSTVHTDLHPHNPELKSHEGYHIQKLSPEKGTSEQLNKVRTIEQQNPEYLSELSLSDEADTCLLKRCSLDEQLERYSQQALSLHGEKDSEGQKVQIPEASDTKNAPEDLQHSFSKILCTLKKETDLISHKVEDVEREKHSYVDKLHSLEQSFSKATQEIAVLQEEKHKYSEKIYVLEREKENYAQQAHLLEQENRNSSNQINSMKEYMSKISLLEEENKKYSQKISALLKEVTDSSQKVLQLQKENENYSQRILLLEDENKRHSEVSFEFKDKADLYLQTISTLEQDNARYSLKICTVEHENNIFLEKLNSIEEEIDRCSQKIIDSYETHSEYAPVLSRLGKVATKGSNINGYPVALESNYSLSKVCCVKSSQAQNDNNSIQCSGTTKKSEELYAENISQKLFCLEQKKCTFCQLICDLVEQREKHSQQISELLQDKDKYLKEVYNVEEEKVKCSEKNDDLEAEKQALLGHLNNLKTEKEQLLKEMSTIQEDHAKCLQVLAQQQKDNTRLRNKIHKVRKETSDKVVASKEATYSIISENKDLKELVLHLKGNYENVIKDTMFGMEEIIKGLETENESLLNRIHQMETEIASEISKHVEQILMEREQLINRIGELEDEARSNENVSCILEPSNIKNVLSRDSFIAGKAREVVSMKHAHKFFPKNTRVPDSEIIDNEVDTESSLVLKELSAISEDHNDSLKMELDGQPLHEDTQCNVPERRGLLLTPLDQQHISVKEQDEDFSTLKQENIFLKQKLEEAHKEVIKLKQHESLVSPDWSRIVDGSQEMNETEATRNELQQKALSLEFKLKDQAALPKQRLDLQNNGGVHLLDNKAKLASLVQKCQDGNNFITQLVKELQRLMDPQLIEEAPDLVNGTVLSPWTQRISPLTYSDSIMRMNCLRLPVQSDFSHHLLLSLCEAPTPPGSISANQPDRREHSFKGDTSHPGQMQHLRADANLKEKRDATAIKNNTWVSTEETGGSISPSLAKSELPNVFSASPVGRTSVVEKSPTAEPLRATRIKQGPPTAVDSVYIIKAVGKCNLMIGWGRPAVDELGCSNGIFIKGYRIYVDGNFYKSIMSSACTKTILEKLDLSVPFRISVQTVGGNGLVSEKVHAHFSACFTIRTDLPSITSSNSEATQSQCNFEEVL